MGISNKTETSHNKRYTLRRGQAPPPGLRSARSATPPTPHFTHILPALEMLRISLSGRSKRRIPLTLGESFV